MKLHEAPEVQFPLFWFIPLHISINPTIHFLNPNSKFLFCCSKLKLISFYSNQIKSHHVFIVEYTRVVGAPGKLLASNVEQIIYASVCEEIPVLKMIKIIENRGMHVRLGKSIDGAREKSGFLRIPKQKKFLG